MAYATSVTTGSVTPGGLNTPTTIATLDDYGLYEYRPNLVNMAASDVITFRVTSEAGVVTQLGSYSNDQTPDGARLQFLVAQHETGVLLKQEQTAGTARAVPYELVRIYDDSVA